MISKSEWFSGEFDDEIRITPEASDAIRQEVIPSLLEGKLGDCGVYTFGDVNFEVVMHDVRPLTGEYLIAGTIWIPQGYFSETIGIDEELEKALIGELTGSIGFAAIGYRFSGGFSVKSGIMQAGGFFLDYAWPAFLQERNGQKCYGINTIMRAAHSIPFTGIERGTTFPLGRYYLCNPKKEIQGKELLELCMSGALGDPDNFSFEPKEGKITFSKEYYYLDPNTGNIMYVNGQDLSGKMLLSNLNDNIKALALPITKRFSFTTDSIDLQQISGTSSKRRYELDVLLGTVEKSYSKQDLMLNYSLEESIHFKIPKGFIALVELGYMSNTSVSTTNGIALNASKTKHMPSDVIDPGFDNNIRCEFRHYTQGVQNEYLFLRLFRHPLSITES